MAPIKFEEQIKDKLEKRSLSPSSDSWSKLSERLDAKEKSRKKPIYWWIGVAAGLVILLAVTIQFFNNENEASVLPTIVEEKKENTIESSDKTIFENEEINDVAIKDVNEKEPEKNSATTESQILDYKKTFQNKQQNKTQVADKVNKPKKEQQELTATNDEDIMKEAVASALKNLKTENPEVTDREVDSLLKLASKELLRDKILKETSETVDASELLMSVEDEIGQSFRSKVFEALKESYETVKTAVAERNN